MRREELFEYVKKAYGIMPEYLWNDDPTSAVFRNKSNQKWFGICMRFPGVKVGLETGEPVDIVNVKMDPEMVIFLKTQRGYAPAWHMNKKLWITIILNGFLSDNKILDHIDESYKLVDRRKGHMKK